MLGYMSNAPSKAINWKFFMRNSNLLAWSVCIEFTNENLQFLHFYVKSHQEHRVRGLCLRVRHTRSPSRGCPWQSQLTTGTVPRQGQMAECLDATAISQPELKGPNQALGNCQQLEHPAGKSTPSASHVHGLEQRCAKSSWGSCVRGVTAGTCPHHSARPTSASLQGNNPGNP